MHGHPPTELMIEKRAYELWELAGKPHDQGDKFWFQAEREVKFPSSFIVAQENPIKKPNEATLVKI